MQVVAELHETEVNDSKNEFEEVGSVALLQVTPFH